jgi:hypothetical protein
VRVHNAWNGLHAGGEPPKPALRVAWPADLDEQDPALDDLRLPVDLPNTLKAMDRMRAAVATYGGTLMPSSFVFLASPGLVLDRVRDAGAYRFLNETLWPFSYAHIRRYADFQNRVFRKYATVHGLPFNDLASVYPADSPAVSRHRPHDAGRHQAQGVARVPGARPGDRTPPGRWPPPRCRSGRQNRAPRFLRGAAGAGSTERYPQRLRRGGRSMIESAAATDDLVVRSAIDIDEAALTEFHGRAVSRMADSIGSGDGCIGLTPANFRSSASTARA